MSYPQPLSVGKDTIAFGQETILTALAALCRIQHSTHTWSSSLKKIHGEDPWKYRHWASSVLKTTKQQFSMSNQPNDPFVFGFQTNIIKCLWETSHKKTEPKLLRRAKRTQEAWEAASAASATNGSLGNQTRKSRLMNQQAKIHKQHQAQH